jgi:hypothetical protein
MKNIELKNIQLVNFKGIKFQSIDFEHNTDIFGANKAGKTTIFDAVTWVLFGKDSQDRKDFELKTLNEKNQVIEKLDHEVTATFLVDGETVVLRKILTEKWTKKKGSATTEFTGNTIEHYWNDVPLGTAREYQEKVSLICEETVFKLITNPASFMSLKWQDRREVLVKIADKISDTQLAHGNRDFEKLLTKLSTTKTLEEYNKEIQASIKKAKEDLKAIPTRIDEVVRNTPEALDFKQISYLLETKQGFLEKIDADIQDKSGMYDTEITKNNEVKSKLNLLKNWVSMNESVLREKAKKQVQDQNKNLVELQAKITENAGNITIAQNKITTLTGKAELLKTEILDTKSKVDAKRAEWHVENAKTLDFEAGCFDCPTCKRAFEATDIEAQKTKMHADFIASKKVELAKITTSAKSLIAIMENQQTEVDAINLRIQEGKKFIETLTATGVELMAEETNLQANTVVLVENEIYKALLASDELHHQKLAEITTTEASIVEIPKIDYSELITNKNALVAEILELNKKMHTKDQIKLADDRVKKLQAEETILSQQILDVERTQFIIDNFNRVKIEALENSINSKLQYVKFKMFEQQINGGEVPCCEALLNGVPYTNVNTAGRLNIGLDIINMLCGFYQVQAPIIIDNRESVTDIIECESQIINLVVSPQDEVLRVAPKAV